MQSVTLPVPAQKSKVTSLGEYKERKDPFSMVFPSFTAEFGERGASIIQKMYCLTTKQNVREGRVEDHFARRWCRLTAAQWGEKLGIKPEAARRAIAKLTDSGVLLAWNFNSHKYDRTRWYTVDLEALQAFVPLPKQWEEAAEASDPSLEVWSPFLTSENSIPQKGGMEVAEVRSLYNKTVLDVCENKQTAENVLSFSNSDKTEAEEPETGAEPETEAITSDVQQIAEEIGKAGRKRVRESESEQTPEPSPAPEAVQVILRELESGHPTQGAQLRSWTERRDTRQLPTQVLLAVLNRILSKRDSEKPVRHYVAFAQSTAETLYAKWQSAEEQRKLAREAAEREWQRTQQQQQQREQWKEWETKAPSITGGGLVAMFEAERDKYRAEREAREAAQPAAQPGTMAEAA